MELDLISRAPSAEVRALEADCSEAELLAAASVVVSSGKWFVGECAAVWLNRFSRGRTEAEFGELVGLSSESVCQRLRVFTTFGDVRENYPELKKTGWSHFLAALNWDDAAECLAWANENKASRREMVAWRRMQHGEDLTEPEGDSAPWDNGEGITDDDDGRESAVTDDGVDETDSSSPEKDSPVVTDDDVPSAPLGGEVSQPERAASAGSRRPERIDAAAVAFAKSCDVLRQNLPSLVAAASDSEQRAELESILVSALEEVRSA